MRLEARLLENDLRDGVWSNEVIYALLDREHAGLAYPSAARAGA